MSHTPLIFLSFANDRTGNFLKELEPEKDALQSTLIKYQQSKWGNFYTAATSEPDKLIRDLNKYTGQVIIFHFSGHNEGVNLQFEDEAGNPIPFNQSGLRAFLAVEKRLKLVFLNACATADHVKSLQEAGVAAVIATDRGVGDRQAKKFSESFYDSLVAGNTLEAAFGKAKTNIDSAGTENHIYRGFIREEDTSAQFPWGLHILDEDILSWKLEDEKPEGIRTTQALNKLPGLPMDFVGRKKELQELQQLLEKEKPVLLLNGLGGIGKTTLARQYLHENYDGFDHIAWVSVLSEQEEKESSFKTAAEALGNDIELFRSLAIPFNTEESTEERAKQILLALRNKTGKNLLVIDNAGFSLEDIRTELPQAPNWQVLITSRKELPGFSIERLDKLPPAEALELFYLHYPQGKNQAEDVEALLKHIGYHTLTLELFAKTCQKSPSTNPSKILKLLKDKKLENLSRKVFAEHSNREVAVYSYLLAAFELHELSDDELSILIQWAILPSQEIPWELLCQIFGIEEAELESFEDRVISLQEKGWIAKSEEGDSYRMHQLIQEILRYKCPINEKNCEKIIIGTIKILSLDETIENPVDKFRHIKYGETILFNLKNEGEKLSILRNNLGLRYQNIGHYKKAANLLELSLFSDLSRFGENHPTVSARRSNLAGIYHDLGLLKDAVKLYKLALTSDLNNFSEDHSSIARRRANLAGVYRDLGLLEKAVFLYKLSLASDLNNFGEDHPLVAIRRSGLALVYIDLGLNKEAVRLFELALTSDLENFGESHPSTARKRSNLALAYHKIGSNEEAAKLFELSLASDLINFGEQHPSIAIRRAGLAMVYKDLGLTKEAAELFEFALASDLENFGEHHPYTARSRSNLATIYLELDRKEEAHQLFRAAYGTFLKLFGSAHSYTKGVKSWLDKYFG